jgi:hypothetical protein
MSDEKKPSSPSAANGGACASGTTKSCPLEDQIRIVEFVEIVTRGAEGVVEGASLKSAKLATVFQRTAKEAGRFQQFINLGKEIEGADKRRPDYGRFIEIKARVEWCSGDPSRSLSGKKIHISYELLNGPKRPAVLKGTEKEGFGSEGGTDKEIVAAGNDGWTAPIKFYLSQFGGDEFALCAQAEEKGGGSPSGKIAKIAGYQTWRKFWYQKTRAAGFAPPAMTVTETAYKNVFVVFELDNDLEFLKANVPDRTFYPEWQAKVGGGDTQVAIIGGHNRAHFYGLYVAKTEKPIKDHLIICEYQWDPAGETPLQTFSLNKMESDELAVTGVTWNSALVSPALSGDLLVSGTWESEAPAGHADSGKNGVLSSADILITKPRSELARFRIKLPASVPDPTVHKVKVKLKLRYAKYWGGESNGYQIIITYKNDKAAYDMCVSHEVGHSVFQVPRDGAQTKKPASLPNHPRFYTDNRGGQGAHCSFEAVSVADPSYPLGRFKNGTCIMFHQLNPTGCKQVFCENCAPYLQLQDLTEVKQPT